MAVARSPLKLHPLVACLLSASTRGYPHNFEPAAIRLLLAARLLRQHHEMHFGFHDTAVVLCGDRAPKFTNQGNRRVQDSTRWAVPSDIIFPHNA